MGSDAGRSSNRAESPTAPVQRLGLPPDLFLEIGCDDPDEPALDGEAFDDAIFAISDAVDRGDRSTANRLFERLRERQAADVERFGWAVGQLEHVEDGVSRRKAAAELRARAHQHRVEACRVTRRTRTCSERSLGRAAGRPRSVRVRRVGARRAGGVRSGSDPPGGSEPPGHHRPAVVAPPSGHRWRSTQEARP